MNKYHARDLWKKIDAEKNLLEKRNLLIRLRTEYKEDINDTNFSISTNNLEIYNLENDVNFSKLIDLANPNFDKLRKKCLVGEKALNALKSCNTKLISDKESFYAEIDKINRKLKSVEKQIINDLL